MTWIPLSRERHFDKAIGPIRDFSFARKRLLLPILLSELRHAVATVPLMFARRDGFFELYGLVGLEKDNNVYVDAMGHWVTRNLFIPACLRTYPCALSKEDDGKMTLLVDESSGRLIDRNDGVPFFNEDGSDGEAIKEFTALFSSILRSRQAVRQACELIEGLGLLEPLEYHNPLINKKVVKVDGLYSINEVAFRELEEPEYLRLKKTYAVDLIYANLYSRGALGFLLHHVERQKRSKSVLKNLGKDIFGGAEIDHAFNFDDFS